MKVSERLSSFGDPPPERREEEAQQRRIDLPVGAGDAHHGGDGGARQEDAEGDDDHHDVPQLAEQVADEEVPPHRRPHAHVVHLVERGADAGEEPGAEPEEGRHRVERELAAVLRDPAEDLFEEEERVPARRGVVRRQERPRRSAAGRPRRRPPRAGRTWVRPTRSSRTKGMAASSASKVSALARKGTWFSSAACRVRPRNPRKDRCQPRIRFGFRSRAPRRPPWRRRAGAPGRRPGAAPAPRAPSGWRRGRLPGRRWRAPARRPRGRGRRP